MTYDIDVTAIDGCVFNIWNGVVYTIAREWGSLSR